MQKEKTTGKKGRKEGREQRKGEEGTVKQKKHLKVMNDQELSIIKDKHQTTNLDLREHQVG